MGNVTSIEYDNLPSGEYTVWITAGDISEGRNSNRVYFTIGILEPPTNVKASVGGNKATITWDAVDDATGYKLYYRFGRVFRVSL